MQSTPQTSIRSLHLRRACAVYTSENLPHTKQQLLVLLHPLDVVTYIRRWNIFADAVYGTAKVNGSIPGMGEYQGWSESVVSTLLLSLVYQQFGITGGCCVKIQDTFKALAYRDYRLLWFSTAMANSGRWAFTVGVGWLIYNLSHNSGLVGLAMFASMIPAVIFNPFVGVLADRYNRKNLLTVALFLCSAATGILGLLTVTHATKPWMVIAVAFVVGIAFSVQMTNSNALMPGLIPPEDLFNASALQGTVNQGSEFLGSALATPLLALRGPGSVFMLCFVLYVASGITVPFIRAGAVEEALHDDMPSARTNMVSDRLPGSTGVIRSPHKTGKMFQPMAEGIRYIRRTSPLGILVIVVALHCSLTMSYTVLLPEFSQQSLHGGSAAYSTIMTMIGLGAVVGTIGTAGFRIPRNQGNLYLITALLSGLSLFGLGVSSNPVLAYAMGFFVGSSQAVFMAVTLTFMMRPTVNAYRGRVSSVYSLMAAGFMAVATYGYGLLGNVVAPKDIMWVVGAAFTLFFAIALASSPVVRRVCRGNVGGGIRIRSGIDTEVSSEV